MIINDESYERVQNAVEDIYSCCEIEDDYTGWEDVASSAIAPYLEALDEEQLRMTITAFEEYIADVSEEDENLAVGIKTALMRFLSETLEYLTEIYDETSDYGEAIKESLSELNKMTV